eukprot:30725-Hanusia_phi.AAC.1
MTARGSSEAEVKLMCLQETNPLGEWNQKEHRLYSLLVALKSLFYPNFNDPRIKVLPWWPLPLPPLLLLPFRTSPTSSPSPASPQSLGQELQGDVQVNPFQLFNPNFQSGDPSSLEAEADLVQAESARGSSRAPCRTRKRSGEGGEKMSRSRDEYEARKWRWGGGQCRG